jgi:hypothetical protein
MRQNNGNARIDRYAEGTLLQSDFLMHNGSLQSDG